MPRVNMKEKILDAFIELLKKNDFDDIKVNDIVKEANISRQTFYNYFDDLYGIIEYALEKRIINNFETYKKCFTLEQYFYERLNDIYNKRIFVIKLKESKYSNVMESLLIEKSKIVTNNLIEELKIDYSHELFDFYNELFNAGFGTYVYRMCTNNDIDINLLAKQFASMYSRLFDVPIDTIIDLSDD